LVSCCFLILLVFDHSVFELAPSAISNGVGMNPPLRHPAMILHPPTLFLGYSGFIIPFAWAIAVMGMSPSKNRPPLFGTVRNWILISWIFLTIGNALGSWWAYEELGWGGFWAWDPVENSSFMPWVVGTALLHSFKKFRPNSKIARWAIFLSLLTYSLCIFGRFLAKYGLVESVHTFGQKGYGMY
ncbi:MAG: cytochrome c biogenesis protein CcsA, partial [Planctomycetes bacterium]|nr:cytochrome c biogenesis protein CcsA [Planctomycetota bacterium]